MQHQHLFHKTLSCNSLCYPGGGDVMDVKKVGSTCAAHASPHVASHRPAPKRLVASAHLPVGPRRLAITVPEPSVGYPRRLPLRWVLRRSGRAGRTLVYIPCLAALDGLGAEAGPAAILGTDVL